MRLLCAQQIKHLMTILILPAAKIKMVLTSLDAHHLSHLLNKISLQNLHNSSPISLPFLIVSLVIVHCPYSDHKGIITHDRATAFFGLSMF